MLSPWLVNQSNPEIPPYAQATKVAPNSRSWSAVLDRAKSGGEHLCFARFSGMICEISALIRVGNNHEGSIPFTRSIDYK